MQGFETSNENLVLTIDSVEQLLQTYQYEAKSLNASDSQETLGLGGNLGALGTASRVGGPQRYTIDVINKIDHLIAKCRAKMDKMVQEYKNLHQIFINSEQRKREKQIKAQIQVNEAELQKLREHYNGLVRYNEGNINAVIKTSKTTKKFMN